MTRIRLKLYTPLAWLVVLMLAVPWTAFADTLVPDGDGAAPLAVHDLTFGSVCAGTTTTKPVVLGISRNGTYRSPNAFINGANVTISVGAVSGAGLSANGGGSVTLPSTWSTAQNNTIVGSVSSSVTLAAGAAGSFSGSVTYNASGTSSNSKTGTVTVPATLSVSATIVNCDNDPPVLSLPSDITTEATSASGAVVTYTATATDANPAHPTVTCTPTSGSTFPIGVTTVNCSATDAAGNKATGSFKVTVQDTTAPVISGTPANVTVEATGPSGAVVSYTTPTATDTVDGSVAVTCSPASGSTFPLGTTTVTCSATDSHGNTAKGSFKVTVTYSWSNFLQPINLDGSSRFKLGSTIPVKFQLTGAGAGITDAVAKLYVKKVDNNPDTGVDEAISTAASTTGNLFRYDATSQQYIFNLSTKAGYTNPDGTTVSSFTQGTWTLYVVLGDGVTRSINIQLVK